MHRAATSPEKLAKGRSPRGSPAERAARSARLAQAERSRDMRGKVLPQQAVAALARARLYSVTADDPFRSALCPATSYSELLANRPAATTSIGSTVPEEVQAHSLAMTCACQDADYPGDIS